jgi:hypothetical protein
MKAKLPVTFTWTNIVCKLKNSEIKVSMKYTTKEGDEKSCVIKGHITPKGVVTLDISIQDTIYFDTNKMITLEPLNN